MSKNEKQMLRQGALIAAADKPILNVYPNLDRKQLLQLYPRDILDLLDEVEMVNKTNYRDL